MLTLSYKHVLGGVRGDVAEGGDGGLHSLHGQK
jgi:hypothetical protein